MYLERRLEQIEQRNKKDEFIANTQGISKSLRDTGHMQSTDTGLLGHREPTEYQLVIRWN